MPNHYTAAIEEPKKNNKAIKQSKPAKMPKPLNKPRKELSKMQKDYMKKHSIDHTPKQNKEMIRLMKLGYCIEQSHKMAIKKIGK